MHCIPDEPDFQDGQLAEKALWDALRDQLPDDVVLTHSVQVRHGRAEHEIDILVLWPGVGLAAIEVRAVGSQSRTGSGTSPTAPANVSCQVPSLSPKEPSMP